MYACTCVYVFGWLDGKCVHPHLYLYCSGRGIYIHTYIHTLTDCEVFFFVSLGVNFGKGWTETATEPAHICGDGVKFKFGWMLLFLLWMIHDPFYQ